MSEFDERTKKIVEFSGVMHARVMEAARSTEWIRPMDMPNIFATCAVISLIGFLNQTKEKDIINKLAQDCIVGFVTSLHLNDIKIDVKIPEITEEDKKKSGLFFNGKGRA